MGMSESTTADRAVEAVRAQVRSAIEPAKGGALPGWVNASAMLLVDAIAACDVEPLEAFLDESSRLVGREDVDQGAIGSLAAVAQWGVARTRPTAVGRSIDLRSAVGRILLFVSERPEATNTEIWNELGLAEATVSRIGRRLEADGLVRRTRAGKEQRWRLTPMGDKAIDIACSVPSAPRAARVSTAAADAAFAARLDDRERSRRR